MRPPKPCPRCGEQLCGGPVIYTCTAGHGVTAADLPTDYRPTRRTP